MTEADVEKLRVLTQFVLAEHVKHFDAAGHGGADEEFVSFGCEFDALASALGVESVEKPRRIGGNVEYNDAVVVGPQCSGHGHLAVGVKGKALGTIGHLLDDSVDDGFFQRQICKENVGVINAVSGRTLANQCLFPIGADSKDEGGVQKFGGDSGSHLNLIQVLNAVALNGIPLDCGRGATQRISLSCDQSMAFRVNPKTSQVMRLRVLAKLDQLSILNAMHIEMFVATSDEALPIRMSQNMHGAIVKKHAINDAVFRRRQVDEGQHIYTLRRHLRMLEHFRCEVGIRLRSGRQFQFLRIFRTPTVIGNQGVATVAGHGHRGCPVNRTGHRVVNRLDYRWMIRPEVNDRE